MWKDVCKVNTKEIQGRSEKAQGHFKCMQLEKSILQEKKEETMLSAALKDSGVVEKEHLSLHWSLGLP